MHKGYHQSPHISLGYIKDPERINLKKTLTYEYVWSNIQILKYLRSMTLGSKGINALEIRNLCEYIRYKIVAVQSQLKY